MLEYVLDTGEEGKLRIQDFTDDPDDMSATLWLGVPTGFVATGIPWAYSINGETSGWQSYDLWPRAFLPEDTPDFEWFRLTILQLSDISETLTLHLGDTNTVELGGPTDLAIDLYVSWDPSERMVDIRVDGVWRKATPYVKHDGVWRLAQPFVRDSTGWQPVS